MDLSDFAWNVRLKRRFNTNEYKIFMSKTVWNRVGVTYERVVIKIRFEFAGGRNGILKYKNEHEKSCSNELAYEIRITVSFYCCGTVKNKNKITSVWIKMDRGIWTYSYFEKYRVYFDVFESLAAWTLNESRPGAFFF